MFADSLYDSGLDRPSRRSWTTLVSFTLQAFAVACLLALPFLSTQGLPELSLVTHLMVPMSQAAMPARSAPQTGRPGAATSVHLLVAPDHISTSIPRPEDGDPIPPGIPSGSANVFSSDNPIGTIGSIGTSLPMLTPISVAHPPIVSRMMEGNLIHRVQPIYPPIAIQARIEGSVILAAVISRDGSIENLKVVSGHPMLASAAINAVRQWHYRPYVLNGEPIEVETQVTVNFVLGGG
jgi:protein TonB